MTDSKITVKLPKSAPRQPAARGRIMDFAPRKASSPRPATSPRQPAPVRRPAAPLRPLKPHQTVSLRPRKPLAPASVRSAARSTRPAPMAAAPSPATSAPANDTPKPLKEYEDLDNYTDFDDLTLGIIEDLDEPLDQRLDQAATPVDQPTPDKHNFFLPGKSPFINTEKLEKRPLSAFRPDTQLRKNNYVSRLSEASQAQDIPTMVTTSASKRTNFGLIIAILCTIALGAVVGAIAYLAFFQD